MKYILIFYTFWLTPHPHWESITVEPFYTHSACRQAGFTLWNQVRRDGAQGYKFTCKPTLEMET